MPAYDKRRRMFNRRTTNRMIGIIVVLIIVILAVIGVPRWIQNDRFTIDKTRAVRSKVDGLEYRVHLAHGNSSNAADVMAVLNGRTVELLRFLRTKYLRSPEGRFYPQRAEAVRRLLARYNVDNLTENSPRDPEGDTSYTINKGAIVALCLREKDDGAGHDIHDLETLTFVTFHELTHIAIKARDHPARFWEAFRFILEDGRDAGLIRGVNYGARSTMYCGMKIDYNPLFDRGLAPFR